MTEWRFNIMLNIPCCHVVPIFVSKDSLASGICFWCCGNWVISRFLGPVWERDCFPWGGALIVSPASWKREWNSQRNATSFFPGQEFPGNEFWFFKSNLQCTKESKKVPPKKLDTHTFFCRNLSSGKEDHRWGRKAAGGQAPLPVKF